MRKAPLDLRIARALDLVGDQGLPPDADGLPVRNAPSPLSVFVPFIRTRSERRQRRVLQAAHESAAGERPPLRLQADGQWHDTGLHVNAGDTVAYAACGRLFMSRPLEVSVGPRACLWYRVGTGEIAHLPRERGTFIAPQSGPLQLQAALPGAFGSPRGEISRENPPPPMSGEILVNVGPAVADDRAAAPVPPPPPGWRYLWRVGEAAIFAAGDDAGSLCCDTHGDAGILQYPLDVPLTDDLRLRWEWRADELPSRLPEHVQPTHDYLSIAIEFDNGLDLTWMWSSRLPAGTIFQCPLPWWDQRETHWVLRTPADGLGRWIGESRSLRDDYRRAIGGPLPQRVVAIWLIANSAFQSGHGRCRYRSIELETRTDRFAL